MTRFGKKSDIFGNILKVYLVLGKVVNPLWYNLYAFGQNFVVVNCQIFNKQNLFTLAVVVSVLATHSDDPSLNPVG